MICFQNPGELMRTTISYSALMPALRWNEHYEIDFDGMKLSEWYTLIS